MLEWTALMLRHKGSRLAVLVSVAHLKGHFPLFHAPSISRSDRTPADLFRADAALLESGGQFSLARLEHHSDALVKGDAGVVGME